MPYTIAQTNATRNQSTATYTFKKIFIWANKYIEGLFKNNSGSTINLISGYLVARAAGTYEVATAVFGSALTAGQTMILGGLTYTSTGATTVAQLAAAFASLNNGATTGAGTDTGTYSGALTNFSTGPVVNGTTVVFTAAQVGNTTNLAATGTGTAPTITIVAGTSTTASGFIPVTSSNLADTIGITAVEGPVAVADSQTLFINICTGGGIDGSLLTLPSGVTLDTVVGNKSLRDVLEAIGFHIGTPAVEHTKTEA